MYIVRTLLRRFRTLRGMTVVHVGAHKGQEAAQYNWWGVRKVVWIEADPSQIPGLQAHLDKMSAEPRSWFAGLTGAPITEHQIVQALVGDEDGKPTDFNLFSNDGMSNSIFTRSEAADGVQPTVVETGDVLKLHMQTIDTLLPRAGVPLADVDVLTLDIQGAELLALQGAEKLLGQIHYLETEISQKPFYEGGVLLSELEPWLNARGFFNKTWLRRPFMNAVFVR